MICVKFIYLLYSTIVDNWVLEEGCYKSLCVVLKLHYITNHYEFGFIVVLLAPEECFPSLVCLITT